MVEKEEKKFAADYFAEHMINKWRKTGFKPCVFGEEDNTEEELHEYVLSMSHIISGRELKDALKILIEVYEETEKFDWEAYPE